MLARWQFTTLTALGTLSLLLAIANAALFTLNRASQAEIAQRQLFVQQSVALEGLYREIVKALAELGARSNDRAILGILAAQGLNVSLEGAPSAAPAAGSGVARK